MRENEFVSRYLACSYCMVEQQPPHEVEYSRYVESIARSFLIYAESRQLLKLERELHIAVLYALDKTSSAFTTRGLLTVAQNRFFVQSLNNLNKILFCNKDGIDPGLPMFAYLLRLMREQAYIEGYYEYAIFIDVFRRNSEGLNELETIWRRPTNVEHRIVTEVQEAFVIAHELAHVTIVSKAGHQQTDEREFQLQLVSLLESMAGTSPFLATISDTDSELEEELVCDQVAFDFLLHYFSDKHPPEIVFGAIRLFYMHMRIFEVCRNAFLECRLNIGRSSTNEFVTLPSMSRNFARSMHSDLLQSRHGDRAFEILSNWNDWMERHHARISDPTFNTVLRRGTRLWTGPLSFDVETRKFEISRPPVDVRGE